MYIRRIVLRVAVAVAACTASLAFLFTPGTVAGAATTPTLPKLPQIGVAQQAAQWLSGQFTSGDFIAGSTSSTPDYSETVNSILALAAANVDLPLAKASLAYMEVPANTNAYISAEGSDGPGQLSLLILAARALTVDPTQFGGSNLVSRLVATEQTTGEDAGLFGTEAQVPDYDAGAYDQGLALAALHASGVLANTSAISWLVQDQCSDGGWVAPDPTDNPCDGDPAQGAGPDTNTTAEALQGLADQGALPSAVETSALKFLETGQNSDGGWAYDPSAADNQQTSDPDSTSLVMQALIAMGLSPDSATFTVGGNTPLSLLLSFRITSGTDTGAFASAFGNPDTGDLFATFQSIPALAAVAFPFGPSGSSYQEVGSDGGVFNFGGANFYGSLGGAKLNKPVVGIAQTLDGLGYWLVASDGGVFSFGDAKFWGSTGSLHLNKPIVGIAATPDDGGYWLVGSDGGVFAFGDAAFDGSTGSLHLNKPIVGIAATPDGGGYWLVASDGGVFAFGDAKYWGSTGSLHLDKPIVGIAATPDGGGYWLVASDGGVFTFGDATYLGSTGSLKLNAPIIGIAATPDGAGYWLVASDGGVFTFGDATFSGSAAADGVHDVVGVAATTA
jgi:hypothetical protein